MVDSPLPVESSPKDHSYFRMIPSESVLAEASQTTIAGLLQEPVVRVKLATGGEFKRKHAVTEDRIRTIRGTTATSLLFESTDVISFESYIPLGCRARLELFVK